MSTKRTLGVGVISLGWMGRLHVRSYRALSERFPELGPKGGTLKKVSRYLCPLESMTS